MIPGPASLAELEAKWVAEFGSLNKTLLFFFFFDSGCVWQRLLAMKGRSVYKQRRETPIKMRTYRRGDRDAGPVSPACGAAFFPESPAHSHARRARTAPSLFAPLNSTIISDETVYSKSISDADANKGEGGGGAAFIRGGISPGGENQSSGAERGINKYVKGEEDGRMGGTQAEEMMVRRPQDACSRACKQTCNM